MYRLNLVGFHFQLDDKTLIFILFIFSLVISRVLVSSRFLEC
jgi:hypothetical protein